MGDTLKLRHKLKPKTWFQGQTSCPGQKRYVYEGDGFRNHLVAVFEREEDANEAVAQHNAKLRPRSAAEPKPLAYRLGDKVEIRTSPDARAQWPINYRRNALPEAH